MKKDSISYAIVKLIETHGKRYGGQIEDSIRSMYGAKASNASRRCRELVQQGILEAKYEQVNGKGPWVVLYSLKVKETLW